MGNQPGIQRGSQELDLNILNLEEVGPEGWRKIETGESHWNQGFHFPRIYLEAESIVQTCCFKTHACGGHFTLSRCGRNSAENSETDVRDDII
ncbi:MAG TPA: DUF362 domain-containing protein [Chloroflexi bacterium]|nr:DUF362 domain-containing protein [Chloroflexota bacterium]